MYCYKCVNFLITDAEPQNVSCIDLTDLDADFIDLTSPAPNDASIIIVSLLSNTYSNCHIIVFVLSELCINMWTCQLLKVYSFELSYILESY